MNGNWGHATGLPGVTMTLGSDASASTTTDSNGTYSFYVPAGGTYTVTPSLSGYTFSPVSQTFNDISQSQAASFVVALHGGMPAPTLPSGTPAKEYVYFNGQVIAIENVGP